MTGFWENLVKALSWNFTIVVETLESSRKPKQRELLLLVHFLRLGFIANLSADVTYSETFKLCLVTLMIK